MIWHFKRLIPSPSITPFLHLTSTTPDSLGFPLTSLVVSIPFSFAGSPSFPPTVHVRMTQGLAFGPFLLPLGRSNSLGDLIQSHGFKYQLYADTFNIYISSTMLFQNSRLTYSTVYLILPLAMFNKYLKHKMPQINSHSPPSNLFCI